MFTETEKHTEEAQIHRLFDDWQTAVHERDLDKLMSLYDRHIVSFDMIPPLQYNGIEAYRKNWQMGFNCMSGPMQFEMQDMHLTVGDEVAFGHALNHISGTDKDGQTFDNWVRWTTCLRKLNGRWLITHEHVSVPMDMESGRALMDLRP